MTNEDRDKLANSISDALFSRLKLANPNIYSIGDVLKAALVRELMGYLINPVRIYGSLEVVEILRAVADSLELAHKEGLND